MDLRILIHIKMSWIRNTEKKPGKVFVFKTIDPPHCEGRGLVQVLKVGGAGHKVLLLMEGAAHAYVFPSPGRVPPPPSPRVLDPH
jgi:hypothetical protein